MKNILAAVIPFLVAIFVLIILIIINFIKKPKGYWGINIIFAVLAIGALIALKPYFQDAIEKEIKVVEGKCVDFYSKGSLSLCSENIIQSSTGKVGINIPDIYFREYNLQEGKTYRIEYFANTRIIYSAEMIDEE